jgi:hypothetical protein
MSRLDIYLQQNERYFQLTDSLMTFAINIPFLQIVVNNRRENILFVALPLLLQISLSRVSQLDMFMRFLFHFRVTHFFVWVSQPLTLK